MLTSRQFQESIISHVTESALRYYAAYAYHIAFPELAVATVVRLRRVVKTCKVRVQADSWCTLTLYRRALISERRPS